LHSHEGRAATLAQRVRALGGQPVEGSGAWGTLMKLFEGGANLFGEKAAVSALEEGEDFGRDEYKRDVNKLDVVSRTLVETEIIPEHLRTHRSISSLKQAM
jgi:hypothetical protein